MPRGPVVHAIPFVPFVLGLALSVLRFRADDPLGGLAFALGGMALMIVVIFRVDDSPARRGAPDPGPTDR